MYVRALENKSNVNMKQQIWMEMKRSSNAKEVSGCAKQEEKC